MAPPLLSLHGTLVIPCCHLLDEKCSCMSSHPGLFARVEGHSVSYFAPGTHVAYLPCRFGHIPCTAAHSTAQLFEYAVRDTQSLSAVSSRCQIQGGVAFHRKEVSSSPPAGSAPFRKPEECCICHLLPFMTSQNVLKYS